jgi:hypothetical protein
MSHTHPLNGTLLSSSSSPLLSMKSVTTNKTNNATVNAAAGGEIEKFHYQYPTEFFVWASMN